MSSNDYFKHFQSPKIPCSMKFPFIRLPLRGRTNPLSEKKMVCWVKTPTICILNQHLILGPILASCLLPLWGRCPFAVWGSSPADCGSCLLLASLESHSIVSLQLGLSILLCQRLPSDSSTHSKVIRYWRNRRNVPSLLSPVRLSHFSPEMISCWAFIPRVPTALLLFPSLYW